MNLKRPSPYDEKNALDYREMTKRIHEALEEIERDPSIRATQQELAKRAKCSRGTLRNRVYPLVQLKSIVAKRRESGRNKPKKITLEHRTTVEAHIEDKKILLEQVERSRTEAAVWFDKYQESQRDQDKLHRQNEHLLAGNKSLKEQVDNLNRKVSELEGTLNSAKRKKGVLSFLKPVKKRAGAGRKDGIDS